MLILKHQRETASDLAHTKVYHNNEYIGYVIRNRSKFSAVGENWNFASTKTGIPYMIGKTKKELLNKIEEELSSVL